MSPEAAASGGESSKRPPATSRVHSGLVAFSGDASQVQRQVFCNQKRDFNTEQVYELCQVRYGKSPKWKLYRESFESHTYSTLGQGVADLRIANNLRHTSTLHDAFRFEGVYYGYQSIWN